MKYLLGKIWAAKRSIITHGIMFVFGAILAGGSAYATMSFGARHHAQHLLGWQKEIFVRIQADMIPVSELLARTETDQEAKALGISMSSTQDGQAVYAVKFIDTEKNKPRMVHISPFSGEIVDRDAPLTRKDRRMKRRIASDAIPLAQALDDADDGGIVIYAGPGRRSDEYISLQVGPELAQWVRIDAISGAVISREETRLSKGKWSKRGHRHDHDHDDHHGS